MKQDFEIISIPEWALNYLENGVTDNLTDEDKKLVDDFLEEYEYVTTKETEGSFTWYPIFGLATNVVECYCRLRGKQVVTA